MIIVINLEEEHRKLFILFLNNKKILRTKNRKTKQNQVSSSIETVNNESSG